MFGRQYYSLVAGLREYTLESDGKGFDARQIIDDICAELSAADRKAVQLLYTYYDIENIISMRAGRSRFSPLGNLTREQLSDAAQSAALLPGFVSRVLEAYDNPDSVEVENTDTSRGLSRSLLEAYYQACACSRCRFLVQWAAFDRDMRNIIAATAARSTGQAIADVTVGGGDVAEALARSSAADFGLRAEVGYMDALLAAIAEEGNLLEKERRIDMIRWEASEEMAPFDYFDVNAVLSYLVRVNIVHRWLALDAQTGRRMFRELLDGLGAGEKINSVQQ